MDRNTGPDDRQRRLLREIGGLSDRVRELRSTGAGRNSTQIKALEVQSRAKWQELRMLRAAPASVDPSMRSPGGRYQWPWRHASAAMKRGLMAVDDAQDDDALGIRHRHAWEAVTARPALQSAHDTMRWDVSKSRIISINMCTVCGEFHANSVQECTDPKCRKHAICERPHR
jgi:hypothetical protein